MTSLSEVYEPDAEFQTSLRRLYAGIGLFVLGSVLVVAGMVVGTTGAFTDALWQARELGGILAGLGVPAVFIGVFAVLPAGRRTTGAAVIGAAVALLGVALFVYAFPCQWSGGHCPGVTDAANLTLPVTGVYFLGTMTTFWCLFVGVANFKSRNNPGGTASVEVTAQGETRIIEAAEEEPSAFPGTLGVFGDTPNPEAETQTNRDASPGTASDGGADSRDIRGFDDGSGPAGGAGDDGGVDVFTNDSPTASREDRGGGTGTADRDGANSTGGARTTGEPTPTGAGGSTPGQTGGVGSTGRSNDAARPGDWSPSGANDRPGQAAGRDRDKYCGSCAHFRYVETENGMQPYCGAHDELMDDMEACEQWTSRSD